MAGEISKVSLGFAEFVSQLIHETFDAILSAQNYQLTKFAELEHALQMPDSQFRKNYIAEEAFTAFQQTQLGFIPVLNYSLTTADLQLLQALLPPEELKSAAPKNKLTEAGVRAINAALEAKLVATERSKLTTILNRPELARLLIDSGEIKAKLELFCLNESEEKKPEAGEEDKLKAMPPIAKTAFSIKDLQVNKASELKIREITDNQTQLKTLLLDKASLSTAMLPARPLPATRIVANPIAASTSTTVFSEVTIKFKTL